MNAINISNSVVGVVVHCSRPGVRIPIVSYVPWERGRGKKGAGNETREDGDGCCCQGCQGKLHAIHKKSQYYTLDWPTVKICFLSAFHKAFHRVFDIPRIAEKIASQFFPI